MRSRRGELGSVRIARLADLPAQAPGRCSPRQSRPFLRRAHGGLGQLCLVRWISAASAGTFLTADEVHGLSTVKRFVKVPVAVERAPVRPGFCVSDQLAGGEPPSARLTGARSTVKISQILCTRALAGSSASARFSAALADGMS